MRHTQHTHETHVTCTHGVVLPNTALTLEPWASIHLLPTLCPLPSSHRHSFLTSGALHPVPNMLRPHRGQLSSPDSGAGLVRALYGVQDPCPISGHTLQGLSSWTCFLLEAASGRKPQGLAWGCCCKDGNRKGLLRAGELDRAMPLHTAGPGLISGTTWRLCMCVCSCVSIYVR